MHGLNLSTLLDPREDSYDGYNYAEGNNRA